MAAPRHGIGGQTFSAPAVAQTRSSCPGWGRPDRRLERLACTCQTQKSMQRPSPASLCDRCQRAGFRRPVARLFMAVSNLRSLYYLHCRWRGPSMSRARFFLPRGSHHLKYMSVQD